MTTSWTAEQRRSMHRAGIPSNVMDRLLASFEGTAENSKLDHIISVEDYAENRILTTANFEAALIAALAAANAVAGSGDVPVGVAIWIPAGDWPMTATLQVKARASYASMPLLVGAGSGATYLTWDAMPTGGTYGGQGVCVWFDGYADGSTCGSKGGLVGMTIRTTNAAAYGATGLYFEGLLDTVFEDVVIRGFQSTIAKSGQTGVVASCAAADATYGTQVWSGLTGMSQDSVGRVLTTTGATTGANNGTFLITHYVSATSVKVYNPSGTSDASNTALHWTEKYNGTGIRCRGDYTNSRGDTATNSQQVRMVGVKSQICRIGYWFESVYPFTLTACQSNQCTTHDVVLGHNVKLTWTGDLMQSSHGGFMIWEIPYKIGNKSCTFEGIYHEGSLAAVLKTYAPISSHNDYVLRRVDQANATYYVDASGTRSIVVEVPGAQAAPTYWLKARTCGKVSFTGAFEPYLSEPTKWDLDLPSLEGFELHSKQASFHGQRGDQKSLNRFLISRNVAAEIWDPRIASLCQVNAGNLEQITGAVNAIVATPYNAGIYPTYQTANASIGGRPSWTNVAGANAACGALKATMTTGALPVGSRPALLAVYRLPAASTFGTGTRYFLWTDGTRSIAIGSADAADASVNTKHYVYANTPSSGFGVGPTYDVLPQAVYAGEAYYYPTSALQFHGQYGHTLVGLSGDRTSTVSTAAGTVVMFGPGSGALPGPAIEIAYLAVLKRGLTYGEIEQVVDLMAAEWPGIARY
jgi:hypothetical protein